MDSLILGIDGADLRVYKGFKMPYLHQLIRENEVVHLEEDLISRGWARIISGVGSSINKGLYIMPKLDDTHDFTLKYSFNDLKENVDRFIWDFPIAVGDKVGIMNIPTTYPAPTDIEGFFVSGAGGGLYKVDGIPLEMCDSQRTAQSLSNIGYDLELRFKPSGIKDASEFFEKLNAMMEKRFKAFTSLAMDEEVGFGFLALRATANMQYVLMYHIEEILRDGKTTSPWDALIKNHFRHLDRLIEELFSKTDPKNFIITSDHGMAPQKSHANFNLLLEKIGYLSYRSSILDNFKGFVINLAKKSLSIVSGKKFVLRSYRKINWEKTTAFTKWYSNTIYINDSRFDGSISNTELSSKVDEICSAINDSRISKENGFYAKPYRLHFRDSKNYNELPDIVIEAPDEVFHKGNTNRIISKSAYFGPLRSLEKIPTSMYTGTKGKAPICIVSKELAKSIDESWEKDLSFVFNLIKKYYSKKL